MSNASSGISSISRPRNFNNIQSSAAQMPISLFHSDIISSRSRYDAKESDKWSLDATHLRSCLGSLLSNIDLHGDFVGGESLMTEDEMLQVNLVPILLYSAANGYFFLDGVPIQSVLKYLSRCLDFDLLSEACHSAMGKALAENLFRAAIEAKDKSALKSFLRFPSIDINSIICIHNGQKYTPIERAASLQDLGIVQLLLGAKADVRKTYDLEPDRGILGKLLGSIHPDGEISSDVVKIGKILLQAGAKVHLDLVRTALQAHNLPGLAFGLVYSVSDVDHSDLIRGGLLSLLPIHLDDWQAEQATKNIIMACERTKCRKCLDDYKEEIDWALIQGAKRGHLGLVQLLLKYSETPHRALSGAIRSGRSEVIDAILTLKPDLNALPHSIDDQNWKQWNKHSMFEYDPITTSHAEAIEAKNDRLVLMMEDKGALRLLSEGGRFEPAINAASKNGDMEYVRKLLRCCSSPNPRHMSHAVVSAIQEDHEEIFRALLAAGADVNFYGDDKYLPDALYTAMLRRNSGMVSAILDADVNSKSIMQSYHYEDEEESVLGEAVKWGDRAIIQALLSACPEGRFRNRQLCVVLERGDMAGFDFLLGCKVASVSALTCCLEIGLSRGDAELIQKLVDRGADLTDPEVLVTCVEKYPAMLPFLCKHITSRKSVHVVPGFATNALKAAIRCGRAGLAAMGFLLKTGHVDAKSFSERGLGGRYSIETPLGLAITISRDGHQPDFEVISKLLDYGCDPNSTVRYLEGSEPQVKQTALLDAIDTGNPELVLFLIDRGARVNHEATLGLKRTPLQKAVEVDSLEIVTLLLEKGANVNARPAERSGATAFQLAAIRGNRVIAARLLQHGANLFAPPAQFNGRWPLEGAAENGRIQMIFYLWELSKSFFDVEKCQNAMQLAEGNGFIACRDAIAALSQEIVATIPALDQN